jgi:hypothetical protein
VLLLRYDGPPPLGVHWLTPGGGIDPGETARVAEPRRPLSAAGHVADSIPAWEWFSELPAEPVWPAALPSYLQLLRRPG